MIINLLKSRRLFKKKGIINWEQIVYTILTTTKTLNNSFIKNKTTYFKDFSDFTLEVTTLRYENNVYIMGVNKNGKL